MKRFLKTDIAKVLLATFFIFIWVTGVNDIIRPLLVQPTLFGEYFTTIGTFIIVCVITPLWEELYYRAIPFMINKKVNEFTGQDFTLITMLLTSLVFALAHSQNGIFAILMQGIAGFVLSCVYITTKRPYLSCVLVHALWNTAVLYLY